MLITTVRLLNIGTTFSNIVPADIKVFMQIQFVVPKGGIEYRYNDDTQSITKIEGVFFTHPLITPANSDGCCDEIYVKAPVATTVVAEIQYGV